MKIILLKNKMEKGFSLIEILVTLMVITIGFLGIMSLQINAVRNTHGANIHSQATVLTNDMIERITSNPGAATNGQYNIAHGEFKSTNYDCVTNSCTTTELAEFDVNTWQKLITDSLPEGGGEVSSNGSTITVSLRWDDDRDGDTGKNCPASNTDLDCLQVSVSL